MLKYDKLHYLIIPISILYVGSYISAEGGLNERYGRVDELDSLAREYMTKVHNRNTTQSITSYSYCQYYSK